MRTCVYIHIMRRYSLYILFERVSHCFILQLLFTLQQCGHNVAEARKINRRYSTGKYTQIKLYFMPYFAHEFIPLQATLCNFT